MYNPTNADMLDAYARSIAMAVVEGATEGYMYSFAVEEFRRLKDADPTEPYRK